MNETDHILTLAAANQRRAHEILRDLGLREAWQEVGARAEVVGSLRTGLLMKHLDIDLHIYSPAPLRVEDSFAAMARIAAKPGIRRVEYANLLDEEDCCLEWHARYEDRDGRRWQIDLIHMAEDSPWAGYFEPGRRPHCGGADAGDSRGDPAAEIRDARRGEDPRHRLLPGRPGGGRAQLCGVCGLAAGTPRRGNRRMDAVNEEEPPGTYRP